jgi:pilus assembly protein CpaD
MHKPCTTIAGRCGAAVALRAAIVAGCALFVCGCQTDNAPIAGVPAAPADYRMRHPITIREGERTFEIFVGSTRGTLTPAQRAEVTAFAQTWKGEATGGVIIDVPVGSSNAHAAAEALPEVRSLLAANGVPPQGIVIRNYHPAERVLATIRVTYPKIVAQAGPCGIWPEDLGPSMRRDYFENQPWWNLGCSQQHNLAVMVDNPADLVQPRGETPPYEMRRTTVDDKYRQGQSTATTYANPTAGRITDVGQ